MVMIIILTLSAIVGGFAYAMKVEMTLARNADYENDMVWLARSAVELARYKITLRCPGQQNIDALNQPWAGGVQLCNDMIAKVPESVELVCGTPGGTGTASFKITDMSRKFDINMVAGPQSPQNIIVLQNALNQMGVDSGMAQTITDSIQDWIGPRETHARLSGAKDDFYMNQQPPYYCKCGYIDDINELLLIKGIKDHPEIFWGSSSSNHTTSAYELKAQNSPFLRDREQPNYPFGLNDVFSAGSGALNLNTAPMNILQMIPGLDETRAEQIVQTRAGVDRVDGNEDDAPLQNAHDVFQNQFGATPGGIPGGNPAGQMGQLLGVQSFLFQVKVDCTINGYHKEYTGMLRRDPRKPNDYQLVQFYWK
ncbi:MAG: ral secretion pathway protein [Verrucomicrobiales bacterium]|nr:ral secretion pathway protein [Verrucomicrobiales bacterium]